MHTLKTSGSFMLIDPETRIVFEPEVPTKVPSLTAFMNDKIDSGDLVRTDAPATVVAEPAPPSIETTPPEIEIQPVAKKKKGK